MARSREEKAQSHERIVQNAAAKFREVGLEGIGVADLMAAAGLTHGGFYSHFDCRDDLVAEALEWAFAENERVKAKLPQSGPSALADYVDWYLSADHRDGPSQGCTIAALAGDVGRASPTAREIFTKHLKEYLGWAANLIGKRKACNDRAAVVISTIVGALVLSRAVNDQVLSDHILRASREQLRSWLKA